MAPLGDPEDVSGKWNGAERPLTAERDQTIDMVPRRANARPCHHLSGVHAVVFSL
jgi:hypothetical protein